MALRLALLLLCGCACAASLGHPWRVGPEEIRSRGARELAEAVVRNLHERVDLAARAGSAGGPEDGAEIVMMAPRQALPSIRKYGFLNSHQTRTSGGFSRLPERFLAEQELAMARLPYDFKGRQLLPKYALLVRGRPRTWRLPSRYGDAVVVFKKEVRRRATWTYADTLDFDAQAGLLSLGPGNPTSARTFRYRAQAGDANACRNYCEVQIWGPLDWSDVDHVELSSAPAAAVDPAPAVRNYLRGLDRSRLSDAALIAEIEASTAASTPEAFSQGALDAWELAARPKTPAANSELARVFAAREPAMRAAALYGLSERPWAELKPPLLTALASRDWPVLGLALALSAEHRSDPDVRRSLVQLQKELDAPLSARRGPYEARTREWLGRAAGN